MTSSKAVSKSTKRAVRPVKVVPPVIEVPKRMYPDGRANRIASLLIGETICEGIRIEINKADNDTLKQRAQALKSTMSNAAAAATKRSGCKFITEVGDFRTRSGDIMLVASVTRRE